MFQRCCGGPCTVWNYDGIGPSCFISVALGPAGILYDMFIWQPAGAAVAPGAPEAPDAQTMDREMAIVPVAKE